ncbi:hypothetical protein ABH922_005379 [Rhodococcus sp. 27YEA15]
MEDEDIVSIVRDMKITGTESVSISRVSDSMGFALYVQSMWTDSMESKWKPKSSLYRSNPLFSG